MNKLLQELFQHRVTTDSSYDGYYWASQFDEIKAGNMFLQLQLANMFCYLSLTR